MAKTQEVIFKGGTFRENLLAYSQYRMSYDRKYRNDVLTALEAKRTKPQEKPVE